MDKPTPPDYEAIRAAALADAKAVEKKGGNPPGGSAEAYAQMRVGQASADYRSSLDNYARFSEAQAHEGMVKLGEGRYGTLQQALSEATSGSVRTAATAEAERQKDIAQFKYQSGVGPKPMPITEKQAPKAPTNFPLNFSPQVIQEYKEMARANRLPLGTSLSQYAMGNYKIQTPISSREISLDQVRADQRLADQLAVANAIDPTGQSLAVVQRNWEKFKGNAPGYEKSLDDAIKKIEGGAKKAYVSGYGDLYSAESRPSAGQVSSGGGSTAPGESPISMTLPSGEKVVSTEAKVSYYFDPIRGEVTTYPTISGGGKVGEGKLGDLIFGKSSPISVPSDTSIVSLSTGSPVSAVIYSSKGEVKEKFEPQQKVYQTGGVLQVLSTEGGKPIGYQIAVKIDEFLSEKWQQTERAIEKRQADEAKLYGGKLVEDVEYRAARPSITESDVMRAARAPYGLLLGVEGLFLKETLSVVGLGRSAYGLGALSGQEIAQGGKLTAEQRAVFQQIAYKEIPSYLGEGGLAFIQLNPEVAIKPAAYIGGKLISIAPVAKIAVPAEIISKFGGAAAEEYGAQAVKAGLTIGLVGSGALMGFQTKTSGQPYYDPITGAAGVATMGGVIVAGEAIPKAGAQAWKAVFGNTDLENPFIEKSFLPKQQAEARKALSAFGGVTIDEGAVKGMVIAAKEEADVARGDYIRLSNMANVLSARRGEIDVIAGGETLLMKQARMAEEFAPKLRGAGLGLTQVPEELEAMAKTYPQVAERLRGERAPIWAKNILESEEKQLRKQAEQALITAEKREAFVKQMSVSPSKAKTSPPFDYIAPRMEAELPFESPDVVIRGGGKVQSRIIKNYLYAETQTIDVLIGGKKVATLPAGVPSFDITTPGEQKRIGDLINEGFKKAEAVAKEKPYSGSGYSRAEIEAAWKEVSKTEPWKPASRKSQRVDEFLYGVARKAWGLSEKAPIKEESGAIIQKTKAQLDKEVEELLAMPNPYYRESKFASEKSLQRVSLKQEENLLTQTEKPKTITAPSSPTPLTPRLQSAPSQRSQIQSALQSIRQTRAELRQQTQRAQQQARQQNIIASRQETKVQTSQATNLLTGQQSRQQARQQTRQETRQQVREQTRQQTMQQTELLMRQEVRQQVQQRVSTRVLLREEQRQKQMPIIPLIFPFPQEPERKQPKASKKTKEREVRYAASLVAVAEGITAKRANIADVISGGIRPVIVGAVNPYGQPKVRRQHRQKEKDMDEYIRGKL